LYLPKQNAKKMKNNGTGIKKYINSFGYACTGIADLLCGQFHAKVHIAGAILAIAFGFFFQITRTEWCIVVLAIGLVLSSEAMNTAVEYVVDMVSPEYHELAGKAKDVAAGAVLLIAISAAVVAAIIFLPKMYVF
jgi:diacylglycerol kinase (ATP)